MVKRDELASEVQDLTWAMVDEQATDAQLRRLEEILLGDADARRVYWACMQMHSELYALLSGRKTRLPAEVESAVERRKATSSHAAPVANIPAALICIPLVDLAVP